MANINDTYTGTNGSVPAGYTSTAAGAATIQSNALRVVSPASAYAPSHASRAGLANGDLTVDIPINSSVENYPAIHVRQSSNTSDANGYTLLLQPNGAIYTILKYTSGSFVTLSPGDRSLTFTNGAVYRCRFRFQGSALKAKVWLASASEPTDWGIEATDTTYTAAGFIHLDSAAGAANTARTNTFDNLVVTDLDAGTTGALAGSGPAPSAAITGATAGPPGSTLTIGSGAANHFDVQVAPTGGADVVVHTQAEIAAGYGEAPYFYTTAGGARVHFEARLDAPRTSGSSFSRCELREVNADGSAASWDPRSGEHVMQGTTVITSLPPVKPEVVVAQVFGETTTADIVSIRTQLVSSSIRLRVRIDGTSITSPQIASPYVVGTPFNWKIRFVGGTREVYWSFGTDPLPGTPQVTAAVTTDTSAYFKAGLYNQSNTAAGDAGTAVGAAELSGLSVTHTAATTGALAVTAPAPSAALTGNASTGGALAVSGPASTSALAGATRTLGAVAGTGPSPAASLTAATSDPGVMAMSGPAVSAAVSGAISTGGVLAGAGPAPTGSLAGTATTTGSVAGSLPAPVVALAGSVADLAVLAGTGPAPSALLAGTVAAQSTLAATAPSPAVLVGGGTSSVGPLTAAGPTATSALAVGTSTTGQVAGAAPAPAAALGGSATQPGTLTVTGPTASAALNGDVADLGALEAAGPGPTTSLTGTVTAGGLLAGIGPAPAGALTADTTSSGMLAAAGPAPTAALAGDTSTAGVLAVEAATPVATITGAVEGGGGGLQAVGPAPTSALAGETSTTAQVAAVSPDRTTAITGAVIAAGVATVQAPVAAAALAGTVTTTGVLAATGPSPSAAITGGALAPAVGAISATGPTPTGSLAGSVATTGQLGGIAPTPEASATGQARTSGGLAAALGIPTVVLTGVVLTTGEVTAVNPVPTARLVTASTRGQMQAAPRRAPQMAGATRTGPAMQSG